MATSPDSKPTERQLAAIERPDAMLRDLEMVNLRNDLVHRDEAVRNLARMLADEKARCEQFVDELRTLRAEHHIATLQRDARERQVATLAWEKEDRDRRIEALSRRVDELTAEADRLAVALEKPPTPPKKSPPKKSPPKKRASKKRAPKK